MNPADLERLIDAELKKLPAPSAPHTLRPRVMAAVAARRPSPGVWFSWPMVWKAASAALAVAVVAALGWWLPGVRAVAFEAWTSLAGGSAGRVLDVLRGVEVVATAAAAMGRSMFEPVVVPVSALALVMAAACACFGAALSRVALGGATQS